MSASTLLMCLFFPRALCETHNTMPSLIFRITLLILVAVGLRRLWRPLLLGVERGVQPSGG